MKLHGELKSFKAKGLVSGDKGLEIKIYALLSDDVDVNNLRALLLKPLEIDLNEIAGTVRKAENPQREDI